MIVSFEKPFMFYEWQRAHPTLVGLVMTLAEVWPVGVPMRFVSLNRSKAEDRELGASGIHSAGPEWRALDVGGKEFDQGFLDRMADYVNDHWEYDKNRPHKKLKCAISKQHGTGKHIHLQVHKRTERRTE